ncbi:terpene synthase family protein [Aquiflexum sp.]|uniref:terpene synthase family protein n=1 Tax=Aquiflexum sp. TaxID=1872584 RepID=UPI00359360A3
MKKSIMQSLLKSFLDELYVIPTYDYDKLMKFVEFRVFKKGGILRTAGTTENNAHFILEGGLGLMREGKLERVYFPKQVAFDVKSFKDNSTSPYSLVSLQDSSVVSLDKANEARILNEIPSFNTLSQKIWERAKKSDQEWINISQMHYLNAIPILEEKLGNHFKVLKPGEIGELVGVNLRTISRYNKKLYDQRRSIAVKAKAKELFDYPFSSIIHSDVDEIDSITTCWASEQKLLPNQNSIIKYQKMRMTWLSARLYPESKIEKAIWLAKLYALLFILDDYTDSIPKGEKHAFWEKISIGYKLIMENGAIPTEKGQIRPFWMAFADLWEDLNGLTSSPFINLFQELILNYTKENIWESLNLDLEKIPSIDQYLSKRPVFSGGFLAIHLIPFTMEDDYHDILVVWKSLTKYTEFASRLIYISNDLFSFDKESKIKDPHNWVYLLINWENLDKDKAIEKILHFHDLALKDFIQLDKAFQENYSPANRTLLSAIKNIKYQVSGAVAWSVNDTTRYVDF